MTLAQNLSESCIVVFTGLVFHINCKWIRNMLVYLLCSMGMERNGNRNQFHHIGMLWESFTSRQNGMEIKTVIELGKGIRNGKVASVMTIPIEVVSHSHFHDVVLFQFP